MTFKITTLGFAAGRFTRIALHGFYNFIYRASFWLANVLLHLGMRAAEQKFRSTVSVRVLPPEERARTLPGPRAGA